MTINSVDYWLYLFRFLVDKAKSDPDWDEAVPYEKKIRGKVFEKKQATANGSINPSANQKNELADLGFDVEFDESINEVSALATLHRTPPSPFFHKFVQ